MSPGRPAANNTWEPPPIPGGRNRRDPQTKRTPGSMPKCQTRCSVTVAGQLRALGAEGVRAARQFQSEGTCDYADAGPSGPSSRGPQASSRTAVP